MRSGLKKRSKSLIKSETGFLSDRPGLATQPARENGALLTVPYGQDQHLKMPYPLLDRAGIPIRAFVDIKDRRMVVHSYL